MGIAKDGKEKELNLNRHGNFEAALIQMTGK